MDYMKTESGQPLFHSHKSSHSALLSHKTTCLAVPGSRGSAIDSVQPISPPRETTQGTGTTDGKLRSYLPSC